VGAGLGRLRSGAKRWWDAPAALEVLVGPDRYLGAVLAALIAFAVPMVLIGLVAVVLLPDRPGFDRPQIAVSLALGLATAVSWRSVVRRVRARALVPSVLIVAVALGYQVPLYGPQGGEMATLFIAAGVVAALWVPRKWALAAVALGAAVYGVFMTLADHTVPAYRWVAVTGTALVVLVAIARVLDLVIDLAHEQRTKTAQAARLAAAERASADTAEQAREALAVLNEVLAERVQEQVGEIERLGELRRFLSAPVADAILETSRTGGVSALTPHRRSIAVVFVDLRGFTAFSSHAEPEEILEVLDGYYDVVGSFVRRCGATVGAFQGDGIMAYFNDPVPCDDPAGTALGMALDLRPELDQLTVAWARRGFDLGYGIGVAFGEATLGTVGFAGRYDYAPLGAVVNLAVELCDEATRGEILVDEATGRAVPDRPAGVPDRLLLKGFDEAVLVHRIPPWGTA
jgi:class 3 adenylate cyclase